VPECISEGDLMFIVSTSPCLNNDEAVPLVPYLKLFVIPRLEWKVAQIGRIA
jgi:hypothetical protein